MQVALDMILNTKVKTVSQEEEILILEIQKMIQNTWQLSQRLNVVSTASKSFLNIGALIKTPTNGFCYMVGGTFERLIQFRPRLMEQHLLCVLYKCSTSREGCPTYVITLRELEVTMQQAGSLCLHRTGNLYRVHLLIKYTKENSLQVSNT